MVSTDASSHELGGFDPLVRLPPTKLRRSRLLEGDPQARAKRERLLREQWLPQLLELVGAAQLSITIVASTSQNPTSVYAAIGQGRRASTIRRRVLGWRKCARYFMILSGRQWPRGLHDVLELLHCLATSDAPKYALSRAVDALLFMEKAGGVPVDSQLGARSSGRH